MYESPITIISNGIQLSLKDEVYKAVKQIVIKVDRNELVKALKYDRRQYEKGYADAKMELKNGKWETDEEGDWHCSECKAIIEKDEQSRHYYKYCYHCGAKMEEE